MIKSIIFTENIRKEYGKRQPQGANGETHMKTLGYIYGTIIKALEGSITVEQALEMIRAVLTL